MCLPPIDDRTIHQNHFIHTIIDRMAKQGTIIFLGFYYHHLMLFNNNFITISANAYVVNNLSIYISNISTLLTYINLFALSVNINVMSNNFLSYECGYISMYRYSNCTILKKSIYQILIEILFVFYCLVQLQLDN